MEQEKYEMSEVDILKKNVYDLQKQLQLAYRRIGELREALDVEVQKDKKGNSSCI
jgi:hypothetical protein